MLSVTSARSCALRLRGDIGTPGRARAGILAVGLAIEKSYWSPQHL
jgi:hypothetical protein